MLVVGLLNINDNTGSGVVKSGNHIFAGPKIAMQIQEFSLRNKFSVQQTYIFRSRIISHRVSASAPGSV